MTVLIIACLTMILWCHASPEMKHESDPHMNGVAYGPCNDVYRFIPMAFVFMLYCLYLMECWHCRTRFDLMCKCDVQAVYDYVRKMQVSAPVVWWQAICYHYVRRTRQITRFRNGESVVANQAYYERVNSKRATSAFHYQQCGVKDISDQLAELETCPLTKLRFGKGFVFANIRSANEFEEQRAQFFQDNEQVDDYMEIREGMDLENLSFTPFMIAFADPASRPWFTCQSVFWLFSVLLMSWPLRVFIDCRTSYVNYQIVKLFGTNYLSPSCQNYTGPVASSEDASDGNSVRCDNYLMVPSYSEAMLMDLQCGSGYSGADNWHTGNRPGGPAPASKAPSLVFVKKSNSLTFTKSKHTQKFPNLGASRSKSFAGIGSFSHSSSGYQVISQAEEMELSPEKEEPPPPYEVALKFCKPLYRKLIKSYSAERTNVQTLLGLSRKENSDPGKDMLI